MTLAVTLGDPRGIGPEVVAAAARAFLDEHADGSLLLIGPEGADVSDLPIDFEAVGPFDGSERSAGEVSLAQLRRGVELCQEGRARALVTGPVHKPALHAAGVRHPGQTELLQELTGAEHVGMLMAADSTRAGAPLRILLATTHHPLRSAPGLVTTELLVDQIRLLDGALRSGWAIPSPRIALCALNPHASDGGLFGSEEAEVLAPAVTALRDEGIDVTGPHPADTVFLRALDGRADGVVAPYHDVGMAVFKTLAFGSGVNTTLGLPFPRTSPDHGTAFDIAGTGRADPTATSAAFALAHRLAGGTPL